MSRGHLYYVSCDVDRALNTTCLHNTVPRPGHDWKAAWNLARDEGWHRTSGGRDICPYCWTQGYR